MKMFSVGELQISRLRRRNSPEIYGLMDEEHRRQCQYNLKMILIVSTVSSGK
jgi:hypothetical protein